MVSNSRKAFGITLDGSAAIIRRGEGTIWPRTKKLSELNMTDSIYCLIRSKNGPKVEYVFHVVQYENRQ